jgi:hypothetical protein
MRRLAPCAAAAAVLARKRARLARIRAAERHLGFTP